MARLTLITITGISLSRRLSGFGFSRHGTRAGWKKGCLQELSFPTRTSQSYSVEASRALSARLSSVNALMHIQRECNSPSPSD
ncbi:hypothetical protein BJX64DRAFT_248115 [Aspergillus heterothallicus]